MATLIVFTRYPVAGKTKTRLIPALGAEGASELHRKMTWHTLSTCDRWNGKVQVRFEGGNASLMRKKFGKDHNFKSQGRGDLGHRMQRAFDEQFKAGHSRVVIIGSDCPALKPWHLRLAFDALKRKDLVLGPSADGGYYLIGLRKSAPQLFHADWGTARVLDQTLKAALESKLSHQLLPTLRDVDEPDDLHEWKRMNRDLSVIIPSLNEEKHLAPTLRRIRESHHGEIIITDGGSEDDTCRIAESFNARVIQTARGRSQQCNAGVTASTGGRLLFCHADTLLPKQFDRQIQNALDDPSTAVGAFSFMLDGWTAADRWIEWGTNLRSRYLKLPYGDQGLFLRRDTFEKLGGFAPMQRMEDYDLVRRAATPGRIVTLDAPAITSSRKWRKHGALRITLEHQIAIARYKLGFSS